VIIEQIWTGNNGRNFFYMIACEETGEAAAIDPIDPAKCLARAKERGWDVTQVVNTHEHGDHIGGNDQVVAATGAKVLAPANAAGRIPKFDAELKEGDHVKVGRTGELEVLFTPGHTPIHISLLGRTDRPHLFCGDTLFNAGVGNCNSGDPETLYRTFASRIAPLPDDTLIYPGHEYLANNLGFTLDREPDNAKAKELQATARSQDPDHALITDLGLERQINAFLRLDSPSVIERLREKLPDVPANPDARTVFVGLHKLRNGW
jgi:hydroxyacylglutathione hydrolase